MKVLEGKSVFSGIAIDYRLHPDAFEWMPDQVCYGPLQDWLRYIKSDHEPVPCQRNSNRGTPNDGT